jgi:hypothetical protein
LHAAKAQNKSGDKFIHATGNSTFSSFGGAEVACWPLIPKFVGSNPAEAVGFLKGERHLAARVGTFRKRGIVQ